MPAPTPPPPTAPASTGQPPADARPSSLNDVALLAGVSPGTVSRALSRPDMISEATRARVQAAADRLGYVANGAARALALRKTRTVGALVPRFGGSSFPAMVQALESTLAAQGYTLLLSAPDHQRAQEPAILRTMLERGVDAVALLGDEQSPAMFTMLAANRTPYVLMWAEAGVKGAEAGACVGFDEHAAAALVVDHLADLGHRRVGFIGGRLAHNARAHRRFRGVVEAVARRGLTLVHEAVVETDYGFREGHDAAAAILQRGARVTALVCGNDYLATGALSALHRAGLAVPGAMSVASFNDSEFAPYLVPALTTVRIPIREIGERAAEYLLARLRGEAAEPPAPLAVELVVRESTGPVAD